MSEACGDDAMLTVAVAVLSIGRQLQLPHWKLQLQLQLLSATSSAAITTRLNTILPHSITMKPVTRITSLALRRAAATPLRASTPANGIIARAAAASMPRASIRALSASTRTRSIIPDVENPPPKQSEEHETPTVPTDISTSEFHERADEYLNELVERLEEQQETNPDIEVEYSVRNPPPTATRKVCVY